MLGLQLCGLGANQRASGVYIAELVIDGHVCVLLSCKVLDSSAFGLAAEDLLGSLLLIAAPYPSGGRLAGVKMGVGSPATPTLLGPYEPV
jgi:hypothetical protein